MPWCRVECSCADLWSVEDKTQPIKSLNHTTIKRITSEEAFKSCRSHITVRMKRWWNKATDGFTIMAFSIFLSSEINHYIAIIKTNTLLYRLIFSVITWKMLFKYLRPKHSHWICNDVCSILSLSYKMLKHFIWKYRGRCIELWIYTIHNAQTTSDVGRKSPCKLPQTCKRPKLNKTRDVFSTHSYSSHRTVL